jgi:hypothetical protein
VLSFFIVVAALAAFGFAVWYFGLFGTREAGGIFGAHSKEGSAQPAQQLACGGVILELVPAGNTVANPATPSTTPRSPLATYTGSLTGTMLPTGKA